MQLSSKLFSRNFLSPFRTKIGISLARNSSSQSLLNHSWNSNDDRKAAQEVLKRNGFDPLSFWEQPVAWGDQDPFQHVNNSEYFRYVESARMKWVIALGEESGGPSKAQAMITGQGVSLILKSFEIRFRRPVTFPDTLLIGYKVLSFGNDLSTIHVTASAYSLAQKEFVAHTKEAIVWYDYEKLRKSIPDDKTMDILRRKVAASYSKDLQL